MNIILKCSRIIGSTLALTMLGGIWVHYGRLIAGFGGIARAFHQVPGDFVEQLFAVLLPYSALLLLVAFPFSRLVSTFWWRVAFGLLAGLSLYWFVFALASRSIADPSFFVLASAFLVSQALSIWSQRHPSTSITPATA